MTLKVSKDKGLTMSSTSNKKRLINLFRYNPASDDQGHFQEFALEIEDETNTTILDLLIRIQKEQDPSLAFRYACRVNMCGSCGLVINGRERLACKTNVVDLPKKRQITIRPLNHFPIVKDLVIDMQEFFKKLEESIPYFDPAEELEEPAIIRPDSKERMTIGLATECIQCGCCASSCTMVNYHSNYVGPAALNRAFTLLADSRDGLYDLRMSQILQSCYHCRTEFNCSEVCPKELSPTRSIKHIQLLALKEPARLKRQKLVAANLKKPGSEIKTIVSDNNLRQETTEDINRRRFLKQMTWGLGTVSAVTIGGVLATATVGPAMQQKPKKWIRLKKMEELPVGKVTTVEMRYQIQNGFHSSQEQKPVLITRRSDDKHTLVFNSTCTHLGCRIHWDENKKLYLCACHGGVFDEEGRVMAGPPPRPLDQYKFKIEDEYLLVEVV